MTGEIDKQNKMNQSSNNRAKIKLKDSFVADIFLQTYLLFRNVCFLEKLIFYHNFGTLDSMLYFWKV